jgi:hypothetical protein
MAAVLLAATLAPAVSRECVVPHFSASNLALLDVENQKVRIPGQGGRDSGVIPVSIPK